MVLRHPATLLSLLRDRHKWVPVTMWPMHGTDYTLNPEAMTILAVLGGHRHACPKIAAGQVQSIHLEGQGD